MSAKRYSPEEFDDAGPLFKPPHNGSPTSAAAARSVSKLTGAMRMRIFTYLCSQKGLGATREELELALDMPGSTVRPRVNELRALGLLRETEVTRATSSGRQAIVLEAVEPKQ